MSTDSFRHPHLQPDYYSNGLVPGEGGRPVGDAPLVNPEVVTTTPDAVASSSSDGPTNAQIKAALDAAGVDHRKARNKESLVALAAEHNVALPSPQPQPGDADAASDAAQVA